MNEQDLEPIEIMVDDRASVDLAINLAVDRMIKSATRKGAQGVLVSRLGNGHFVVSLSSAVPFGYTDQIDLRRGTA